MPDTVHATVGVLSAEWEALSDPPGHRWEIIGGELVLTPAASPDQNRAANRLWALLEDCLPADQRVGTDLDWVLSIPCDLLVIVSAPRPDVVVWPWEHPTVVNPVLAVEVLSGRDRRGRILAKRSAYAAAGLPAYLEIDLEGGQRHRFEMRDRRLLEVETGPPVTMAFDGMDPVPVHVEDLRR